MVCISTMAFARPIRAKFQDLGSKEIRKYRKILSLGEDITHCPVSLLEIIYL